MKALLFLAVVGGGFMFGPQVISGTSNSCHALEHVRLSDPSADLNPFVRGLGHFFSSQAKGAIARQAVSEEYPNVPPAVMCATGYWLNGFLNDTPSRNVYTDELQSNTNGYAYSVPPVENSIEQCHELVDSSYYDYTNIQEVNKHMETRCYSDNVGTITTVNDFLGYTRFGYKTY